MDNGPKWGTPEWYQQHPIFGTDFSKSPDDIIEGIRLQLAHLRGQLTDVGRGYPCFREQLETAEGSLTCVISYLYHVRAEMLEVERKKKAIEVTCEKITESR